MNCPYCRKYFAKKKLAIEHIENLHTDSLSEDGMDPYQALYFSTHNTLHGKCMCGCGRDTEWCEKTGKPYKVSNNPECRERLRTLAVANHTSKYGVSTLLNDPEHQVEMQKHRPTYGEYKFEDGGEVGYLSKNELNFLQFCDKVLEIKSNMVQNPPRTFKYFDKKAKVERTYIPDYYLPDYNLLIEIKDGGAHPNTNPAFVEETKYKVKYKDEAMRAQTEYNFIKIVDRKYGPFVETLFTIVQNQGVDDKKRLDNNRFVVITESASVDMDEEIDFTAETEDPDYYFLIQKQGDMIIGCGLCDNESLQDVFFYNVTKNEYARDVIENIPCSVYHYFGDKDKMENLYTAIVAACTEKDITQDMFDMITAAGINYDFGGVYKNNEHKLSGFRYIGRKGEKNERE